MVEVRYVEDEAELLTQLGEDEREGRGISAAGDRDDERTRSEDAVTACVRADGGDDRAWRGRGHRWLGWDSDPRSAGYESAALGHLSYPAERVNSTGRRSSRLRREFASSFRTEPRTELLLRH